MSAAAAPPLPRRSPTSSLPSSPTASGIPAIVRLDSSNRFSPGGAGEQRVAFMRAHAFAAADEGLSEALTEGGESDSDRSSVAQLSIGRGGSPARRSGSRRLRPFALPPWDEGTLDSDLTNLTPQHRLIVIPVGARRALRYARAPLLASNARRPPAVCCYTPSSARPFSPW